MRATLKFPDLPRNHESFGRIVELCDKAMVDVQSIAIRPEWIEVEVEFDPPWQPENDTVAEVQLADALGYQENYSVLV